MSDSPLYVVADVLGKGRGLRATTDIPRGTRILSESPMMSVLNGAVDPSAALGVDFIHHVININDTNQNVRVTSMTYGVPGNREGDLVMSIVRDREHYHLFDDAEFLNHSCANNAFHYWNRELGRLTVHALRDIKAGDDITINYLGKNHKRETRQAILREYWHFTCDCAWCSLPPEESAEKDRYIDIINRLRDHNPVSWHMLSPSDPLGYVRYLERFGELCEIERDDMAKEYVCKYAARIFLRNGDLARGKFFLGATIEFRETMMGEDCDQLAVYKRWFNDPKSHPSYGLSMRWETDEDDVPIQFERDAFEDWMWRRERGGYS